MGGELKPCPFCGSDDVMKDADIDGVLVRCLDCDGRTGWHPPSRAIAAWNARAPSRAAVRAEAFREIADGCEEQAWVEAIECVEQRAADTEQGEWVRLYAVVEGVVGALCNVAEAARSQAEKEERDGA